MARIGDELVVIARASNQAEGEFLVNLLEAEGVTALLRRAPRFDVPDFLAAGPREVLVRASTQDLARDVLGTGDSERDQPERPGADHLSR